MFEKLNEISNLRETYLSKMKSEGKKALEEAFKELFDKHPDLQAIKWQQWIPGFNDGDPCVFTSGACYLRIKGIDSKYGDESEGGKRFITDWDVRDNAEALEVFNKIDRDVNKFWSKADESMLEALFGANVEIVVTRKGIEVSEYDCGY